MSLPRSLKSNPPPQADKRSYFKSTQKTMTSNPMEGLGNPDLIKAIQGRISSQGRITFAEYMEMALYMRGLGYYTSGGEKIGGEGGWEGSIVSGYLKLYPQRTSEVFPMPNLSDHRKEPHYD